MIMEQAYQRMVQDNPEVLRLVDELSLVNPETGVPYGTPVVSDENRTKLVQIAHRVLNGGRIYTREQVVSLIEETLNVSRQRATNGFQMMMNSGVLTQLAGTGVRLVL